jgi:hypothetical protein
VNSGQPYVGGFQVLSDDFRVYKQIDGAQVTVAFPLTNTSTFPPGSWLGAGLFLQAQDHKYLFVDYGFYFMVVLDSDSNMFIDIGFHQTMEGSLPVHHPDANLICDYTWRLTSIDSSKPINLKAQWDTEGFVHYYVNVGGYEFPLTSIKPSAFHNCENMIPCFYGGNVIGEQFPLGRYVDFLQFGLTSSQSIASTQWRVLLEDPKFLKQEGWVNVNKAWSVQGDISFLDQDARWGGRPYDGVDAQFLSNSNASPYEVQFFYNGHTLSPGIVLWDKTNEGSNDSTQQGSNQNSTLQQELDFYVPFLTLTSFSCLLWISRRPNRLMLSPSH